MQKIKKIKTKISMWHVILYYIAFSFQFIFYRIYELAGFVVMANG